MSPTSISVIGAGAWGTALAANAARAGHDVCIWGRDTQTIAQINSAHRNQRYLPDIDLPKNIVATNDLTFASERAGIILLCIPAQTLAAMTARICIHATNDAILISCAKGIDRASGSTMSKLIANAAGNRQLAVLSGPSFAIDVARFLPTAVTIAAPDIDQALAISRTLSNSTLRCYASDDVDGVEIGGALKNVLAIAVGIARGRALGASAEAALVARGFAEMTRVGSALGGRVDTMAGLSGLGDLVLTCSSEKSRNFAYGVAIGKGAPLADMKLAEGAHTATIAAYITKRNRLDAPLIEAVTEVLENRLSVDDAIVTLLSRPIKSE